MRRTLILGTDQKTKDALIETFKTEENIINSGIIGFLEDEPNGEEKTVYTLPVYKLEQVKALQYDAVSVLNTDQYEIKRKRLIYGYGVPAGKISGIKETMYLRLFQKYRDTEDPEIQETLSRLEKFGEFDTMCTYCPEKRLRYEVKWDGKRNLPYVMFFGKKLFYPRNYTKFAIYQGKQWVSGIEWEQQPGSPHTYITGDINIADGDVLIDAGVCEGNFAIRFIDRLSKLYLVESDPAWAEPLQATFEPYKDKVVFCNKYLSDKDDENNITLDTLVGDGRVDFLKMDVEGFEKQALSGAKKMFANNNVKSCICTYHRHGDEEAIRAYFEELGYQTKAAAGFMCFPYEAEALKWTEFRRAILYAKRDVFTGKEAPKEEISWGGILWESDMKKTQPVKKEEPKPKVVIEPEKKVAEEVAVAAVVEKVPEKTVNVKSTAEYWAGVEDTRNSYNYKVGAVLLYIPKKIRKLFQKMMGSFVMLLFTVFVLAACASPESGGAIVSPKADETIIPTKTDETVAPTEVVKKEQEGVFLNEVLQNDTKNVYTYNANLGNMFEFVVAPTENELLILGMIVAEQHTSAGLVLETKDLCSEQYNENAVLCLIYMNTTDGTYAEYYNVTHPDVFQNVRFEINQYSFLQQADYLLSADVVLNGTIYSLCGTGFAEYTEAQMPGNSQSGDETCTYCGGSGICHVCNGMGYTAWGGYENRIDCGACDVPGECYYCQGTGIQVYLTRGVLKQ